MLSSLFLIHADTAAEPKRCAATIKSRDKTLFNARKIKYHLEYYIEHDIFVGSTKFFARGIA
jgi:azurin